MGNQVVAPARDLAKDGPKDAFKNVTEYIDNYIKCMTHASGGYGPWETWAYITGSLPIPEPKGSFSYRYDSSLNLEADDATELHLEARSFSSVFFPLFKTPVTDILHPIYSRSGGRNIQPELEYLECIEYFGQNRGQELCHDYAMDMREHYSHKRQRMRYAFIHQHRGWKWLEQFRGKAKEGDPPPYQPPPPSIVMNPVVTPKFYE